jgi:hypothetical protein
MINKPGITITHQVFIRSARFARESILPHDIISSGSPRPRKLSVDSIVIHELTLEITTNIIAGIIFGRRWAKTRCRNEEPIAFAASTYSLARI